MQTFASETLVDDAELRAVGRDVIIHHAVDQAMHGLAHVLLPSLKVDAHFIGGAPAHRIRVELVAGSREDYAADLREAGLDGIGALMRADREIEDLKATQSVLVKTLGDVLEGKPCLMTPEGLRRLVRVVQK